MKMYEELVKELRETSACFGELDSVSVMMLKAADAIEELSKPSWIPVTERLPEEWRTVLTFQPTSDDKGIIQTCVYIGIPGKWRQAWNHEFLELPVTHWMPLPEPPKEET